MKRLGAITLKERDKNAQDIRNAMDELNAEIENYNKALVAAKEALEPAIAKVNECIDNARGWCSTVASNTDSYMQDRSEKWIDGDAGQEYESWKQEFENIEMEDIEIELPQELELIEDERADALENLPEAPG